MMPTSQEFGGMGPGGKGGPNMQYGGDYASPPQKMSRPAVYDEIFLTIIYCFQMCLSVNYF
jgi:hypothetical protein